MKKIQNDSADGILWIPYHGQLEGFLKGKNTIEIKLFLHILSDFPPEVQVPISIQ